MNLLKRAWSGYCSSTKVEEVLVQCRPSSVLIVVGAMWVVTLACAYMPYVKGLADLHAPLIPLTLAGIGGAFSLLSYHNATRGRRFNPVFILFDTFFYAAAAISCALLTRAPVSYIFGGVFVVMALHWGRAYSFSWLGLLVFTVIPLIGAVTAGADLPLSLIVFMGGVFFVFTSLNTRVTRAHDAVRARRELTIEHLSHLLMDRYSESIKEVRTEYGVMLHKAKNDLQPIMTHVDMALADLESGFSPRGDLVEAQTATVNLKRRLLVFLGELRASLGDGESFRIDALESEIGSIIPRSPVDTRGLVVRDLPKAEVQGSVDNAKVAIRNLVNNSFEAGATRISISGRTLESGDVAILVEDNGAGIHPGVLEGLFNPFVTHGKEHGTGLGLFICRSMMDSLGGSARLVNTGSLGTSFELVFAAAKVKTPRA